MGQEFRGPGFAASPARVLFRDFEVGRTYRARVTITNVSRTINAFRLGDLPEEAHPFFQAQFPCCACHPLYAPVVFGIAKNPWEPHSLR